MYMCKQRCAGLIKWVPLPPSARLCVFDRACVSCINTNNRVITRTSPCTPLKYGCTPCGNTLSSSVPNTCRDDLETLSETPHPKKMSGKAAGRDQKGFAE